MLGKQQRGQCGLTGMSEGKNIVGGDEGGKEMTGYGGICSDYVGFFLSHCADNVFYYKGNRMPTQGVKHRNCTI